MKANCMWRTVLLLVAIILTGSPAISQVLGLPQGSWGPKQGHPKLDSALSQVSEIYGKEGRQRAIEFAKKSGVPLHDFERVKVYLIPEPGKTTESIRRHVLTSLDVDVMKGTDQVLQVRVPLANLRRLADSATGISLIRLPDRGVPLVPSEGVRLTRALTYQAAATGQGVKVAVDLPPENCTSVNESSPRV